MTGSEVVAAARGTPEQQAEATSKFAKHFEELLTAGLTLAGASKVEREGERIMYLFCIHLCTSVSMIYSCACPSNIYAVLYTVCMLEKDM